MKSISFKSTLFALLAFLSNSVIAADTDYGFDTEANRTVRVMVQQDDGKILVGGDFTSIGGVARNRIARLNIDGSVDLSFNPGTGASGAVRTIAIQADGMIVIGGTFLHVSGEARSRLARLHPTGSVDQAFDPVISGAVYKTLILPNGKIMIAGAFSLVDGVLTSKLARLHPNGERDGEFRFNDFNQKILSMARQQDGKLLLGGEFTQVNNTPKSYLARVTDSGLLDEAFNPAPDNFVRAIGFELDGRIMIGGSFFNVGNRPSPSRARLSIDGILDRQFLASAGHVYSLLRLRNGHWAFGGIYPNGNMRILNSSGGFVTVLDGLNNSVYSLMQQSDGKLLIGGRFTETNISTSPGADEIADHKYIARYYFNQKLRLDKSLTSAYFDVGDGAVFATAANGNKDEFTGGTFRLSNQGSSHLIKLVRMDQNRPNQSEITTIGAHQLIEDEWINAIAVDPNGGGVIIGGLFDRIDGFPVSNIARIRSDGSLDRQFQAQANAEVTSLVVEPNGSILVGGNFTTLNGAPRHRIGRLLSNGTLHVGFSNNNTNGIIRTIALQPDGKILIGGNFSSVSGQVRRNIARLHANGGIDTSFNAGSPGFDLPVMVIATTPYDRILVGGYFSRLNNIHRGPLVALSGNGTVDVSFSPQNPINLNGLAGVLSIGLHVDGSMTIGGAFTSIEGFRRLNVARLAFNGALDRNFNPSANDTVSSILILPDGVISIAGSFTRLGGLQTEHRRREKLRPIGASIHNMTLSDDGHRILWEYNGAGPEVHSVRFTVQYGETEIIADASSVAVGWQLSELNIPPDTYVTVTLASRIAGGFGNGSSSKMRATWQLYRPPLQQAIAEEECSFFVIPATNQTMTIICL